MKETCGRCHWEFTGTRVAKMIWCKVDKCYVCWRCWEDKCGKEHETDWIKDRSWHPLVSLFLWSFFLILFTLPLTALVYDIHVRGQWTELEQEPIAGLEDGDLVRVEGVIDGEADVAAFGNFDDTDNDWDWNVGDWFSLSDETGTVNVSTERYYEIEDGPTPMRMPDGEVEELYTGGDSVIVVGKVEKLANGSSILLYWVGPDDDGLATGDEVYQGIGLLLTLDALVCLRLFLGARKKRKAHNQKVNGISPIPVSDADRMMDPSLNWVEIEGQRMLMLASYLPMIIGVMFVSQIFFSPEYFHTAKDYLDSALILSVLAVPFLIHIPIINLVRFNARTIPAVATDEQGVHFFFAHPADRYLEDNFIHWSELDFRHDTLKRKGGGPELVIREIYKKQKDQPNQTMMEWAPHSIRKLMYTGWLQWKENNKEKETTEIAKNGLISQDQENS